MQTIWVTKNGIKLSVATDFTIENNKVKILSNIGATDLIVVPQFSENVVKHRISWYGMILGNKPITIECVQIQATTLIADIEKDDKELAVDARINAPILNANIPGVVWIGGERIVYWEIDGNKAKNIPEVQWVLQDI